MSVLFWELPDTPQVRSLRTGAEITQAIVIQTHPDDSFAVLQRDIPEMQRWQPHPTEAGFFVEEFSANKRLGTDWWEGSVRWSNTITRSPLDQPAKLLGVRTETIGGATVRNARNEFILNPAGDIVSPIDKPERVRVFAFAKNISGLAQWMFDIEDNVNSNTLRIGSQSCEPRTVLFRNVDAGEEEEVDGVTFRVHRFELAYRKSTWKHKFPATGWNQLVTERDWTPGPTFNQTVTRRRPILINGQPPTQEQALDADGKWIQQPTPQDIVILEEDLYPEVDFNQLPLS